MIKINPSEQHASSQLNELLNLCKLLTESQQKQILTYARYLATVKDCAKAIPFNTFILS
jgi:hypothetical protein